MGGSRETQLNTYKIRFRQLFRSLRESQLAARHSAYPLSGSPCGALAGSREGNLAQGQPNFGSRHLLEVPAAPRTSWVHTLESLVWGSLQLPGLTIQRGSRSTASGAGCPVSGRRDRRVVPLHSSIGRELGSCSHDHTASQWSSGSFSARRVEQIIAAPAGGAGARSVMAGAPNPRPARLCGARALLAR